MISMGSQSAEYYVAAQTNEGGRYGFASTSVTPHDFSSGTIGLNLRAESNQANCYVQTYAAVAGTNHRSFWTLAVVPDDIITGITDLQTQQRVNSKSLNSKWIDLQGRTLNAIEHSGIYIRNGKKVAH